MAQTCDADERREDTQKWRKNEEEENPVPSGQTKLGRIQNERGGIRTNIRKQEVGEKRQLEISL